MFASNVVQQGSLALESLVTHLALQAFHLHQVFYLPLQLNPYMNNHMAVEGLQSLVLLLTELTSCGVVDFVSSLFFNVNSCSLLSSKVNFGSLL